MALNFKRLAMTVVKSGGAAAAGGALSYKLNAMIPSKVKPNIRAIAKILVGASLPEFARKSKIAEAAGLGMAGHAGGELAKILMPNNGDTSPVMGPQPRMIEEDMIEVSGPVEETIAGAVEDTISGNDEIGSSEVSGDDDMHGTAEYHENY